MSLLAILENKDFILSNYNKEKSRDSSCLLICPSCNKEFYVPKIKIQRSFNSTPPQKIIVCSKDCQKKMQETTRVYAKCGYCNADTYSNWGDFKKSKSGYIFCNSSCACKYNNQHLVRKDKKTGRSYSEELLVELISQKFPLVQIQSNIRGILVDGLEIDILLPDYKLAIELNGPIHYFPIYGTDRLNITQSRDIKKQILLQQKGYDLIVINTSELKSKKKVTQFITKYFEDILADIIHNYRQINGGSGGLRSLNPEGQGF
jgi:very-short-patch-repair endonuclease